MVRRRLGKKILKQKGAVRRVLAGTRFCGGGSLSGSEWLESRGNTDLNQVDEAPFGILSTRYLDVGKGTLLLDFATSSCSPAWADLIRYTSVFLRMNQSINYDENLLSSPNRPNIDHGFLNPFHLLPNFGHMMFS